MSGAAGCWAKTVHATKINAANVAKLRCRGTTPRKPSIAAIIPVPQHTPNGFVRWPGRRLHPRIVELTSMHVRITLNDPDPTELPNAKTDLHIPTRNRNRALAPFSGHAADCAALGRIKRSNTSITTAESVAAGAFTPPAGRRIQKLLAFCRIAGSIHPSGDSDIRFEVWLPVSGWNGKFLGVGNGGFAGSINYFALADNVKRGYA